MNSNKNGLFSNFKYDFSAGIVVFFVALPLCLGIASASTGRADLLFSGIIAGIVGGIVVGIFSNSPLGVSGPAAGLAIIVLSALQELSFETFLLAVVFSGVVQLVAGFAKAGIIGYYFPSSVIKGMLAAIGITLIIKELPFVLGFDKELYRSLNDISAHKKHLFSDIILGLENFSQGAIVLSIISLIVILLFELPIVKKIGWLKFLPSALIVVIIGIGLNELFVAYFPNWVQQGGQLVQIPVRDANSGFSSLLISPDFSAWQNIQVYKVGLILALVASIETLLSVEATDKLDPLKRLTDPNKELKAQGLGNMVSGLLGGLPITQVIVRSSTNISAGGKTKMATIVHGFILLLSVLFFTSFINKIPMASLAVILVVVGYKLTKVSLYLMMYKQGLAQFLPFLVTVFAILMTDLLIGIAIGIGVAIFYILKNNLNINFHQKVYEQNGKKVVELQLSQEVTFLNKASIQLALENIEEGSKVIINGANSEYITYDVLEIIYNYTKYTAPSRDIETELINIAPIV